MMVDGENPLGSRDPFNLVRFVNDQYRTALAFFWPREKDTVIIGELE
jgi:hypothetical protein